MDNDKEKSTVDGGTSSQEARQRIEQLSKKYYTVDDVDLSTFTPRQLPYDTGLIQSLKIGIPVSERIWSPDDKLWYFSNEYLPTADKIIKRSIGKDVLTGLTYRQAWMTLYLVVGAPEVVINAACDALLGLTDDPGKRTRLETARKICLEW